MRCKHKNVKNVVIHENPEIVHGYCQDCGSHNVEGTWLTAQEMIEVVNPKEKI